MTAKRGAKKKAKRGRKKASRKPALRIESLRAGSILTRKLSIRDLKKLKPGLKIRSIGKRDGKPAFKIVRAKAQAQTTRKSKAAMSNVERFVERSGKHHTLKRYVAIAAKEWRGSRGPQFRYVGTSDTVSGASKMVAGDTSSHYLLFDRKTSTYREGWVPREYRITL